MGNKRYKFSRYAMYNKIEEFFNKSNLKKGKCLLVGDTLTGHKKQSGNIALTNMLPKGSKVIAPGFPEVDIQSIPYKDNTFDYVLADQVLEHVKKPWIAAEEVRRVLKPGGITVLTSCLLHKIHGLPTDYWRFTPDGLKVLCEKYSDIIQADGMGNLETAIRCLRGKRGGKVVLGTEIEKKALSCDGVNLIHVWIIAKK